MIVDTELNYYFIPYSKPSFQVPKTWEGIIHHIGPVVQNCALVVSIKNQTPAKTLVTKEALFLFLMKTQNLGDFFPLLMYGHLYHTLQ